MSSTYPVFEFDKAEWDKFIGTAADGMVITYEVESASETTSTGGEGAWQGTHGGPGAVGSPIGFRYQLGLPGYLRELYCELLENKLVGWAKMVLCMVYTVPKTTGDICWCTKYLER